MICAPCRLIRPVLASAGFLLVASWAPAQVRADEARSDPSAPTDQHRALAPFVGDFHQATEVRLPSGEVVKAGATERGRWIMGGRFVQVDSASLPGEGPAGERTIIYGYDPTARVYTLHNIESSSFVATTATGTYDPIARRFTFQGERAVGRDRAPFRWVLDVRESARIEQTILVPASNGDLAEAVRVTHTRRARP